MSLCANCNTSYDDSFKFCPHCGNPKSQTSDENEWEVCEIELYRIDEKNLLSLLGAPKLIFYAMAIGVNGRYLADKSEPLLPNGKGIFEHADYGIGQNDYIIQKGGQVKLNELINRLVQNGWQPLGKGTKSWSEKFRRKIKKSQ